MSAPISGDVLTTRIGERLFQWRRLSGIGTEDVALRLGVSKSWVSVMERGLRPMSIDMLARVSGMTGIPPEDLVRDLEPPTPPAGQVISNDLYALMYYTQEVQKASAHLYDVVLRGMSGPP